MHLPTRDLIVRYIESKGSECLVTTRELLSFGPRAAVDKCTFALVRAQLLVRVAWGVFHLPDRSSPVTAKELATTKAQAFGRQIMQDPNQIAQELEISSQSSQETHRKHVFQIDGRTSSFRFGNQTIKLKGTSKKNFALGETPVGRISRALLTVGKRFINENLIEQATAGFSESQRLNLLKACSFMPSWLSDRVIAWYYSSQKITSVTITDSTNNLNVFPGQVSESNVNEYAFRRKNLQSVPAQTSQSKLTSFKRRALFRMNC
jgi:hypothetical protein